MLNCEGHARRVHGPGGALAGLGRARPKNQLSQTGRAQAGLS